MTDTKQKKVDDAIYDSKLISTKLTYVEGTWVNIENLCTLLWLEGLIGEAYLRAEKAKQRLHVIFGKNMFEKQDATSITSHSSTMDQGRFIRPKTSFVSNNLGNILYAKIIYTLTILLMTYIVPLFYVLEQF